MTSGMTGDLAGITVVALEQAVAAPLATCRLADAGARVIKLERPEGDFARGYDTFAGGQSTYFAWLNRGKQSVRVDLRHAADRALVTRLAAAADIFVQNLKPGAAARHGLDARSLFAANPSLISCEITGFGAAGPRAHLKAYDLIVQAETGLCAISGSPGRPARVGVSICDIAAGHAAHAAILNALVHRQRGGAGRHIEISLFDSLAEWMSVPLLQLLHGGHEVQAGGVSHPTIAPYGAFESWDGHQLVIAVQNDREWVRFSDHVLGEPSPDPRFASAAGRLEHRRELDAAVAGTCAGLKLAELERRLVLAQIAYGRLNRLADGLRHPHLRKFPIAIGGEALDLIAPPARTSADEARRPALPGLGEHDAEVRREFGASPPI